jgi:KipI family sensor histidine kinase inhibitor
MTPARPVRLFGDSAVVIDVATVDEAHAMASSVEGIARAGAAQTGIEDVIVGYRSVTVVCDPTVTDVALLAETAASIAPTPDGRGTGNLVTIPVALEGRDLDDVARLAGMTPGRVVSLLTGNDLRVAFVGFAPGFAYLVGLDPDLAAIPRRPTPRPAVPGGSVALAGGFAGIYPQTSPGGWHLVGRTGMRMFEAGAPPYSVLQAGDRVRLCVADLVDLADLDIREGGETAPAPGARAPLRSDGDRSVLVEDAGLLSFVQDCGRLGAAALGIPRAGAADPYALRIANRLVGNDEQAAAIEATARGPALRFSAPAHVAVVGAADVSVDGRSVPADTVVPVEAGQRMTTGSVHHGLRAYIAVAGGIEIPTVLGSRSSDVLCRLGVGALVPGDVLGLGPPGRPRGQAQRTSSSEKETVLRVLVGPDVFPPATVEHLISTTWDVDPSSDRIGVRLKTETPLDLPGPRIDSRGMVAGAIQLPPDGRPIALLCDHATVGGYPVIATVVSADLGALGQLRPGDAVRFDPIDLIEAVRARAGREREISDGVVGWYPVRTG